MDKTLLFSTARVCPTQPAPQTQAEEANRSRDARDSAGLLLRIREADAFQYELLLQGVTLWTVQVQNARLFG